MKSAEERKRAFASKMARLRREPEPAPEQDSPQTPNLPAGPRVQDGGQVPIWVRKRLQARAKRQAAGQPARQAEALPNPGSDVPRLQGRPGELQVSACGGYWFRRRLYPVDYVHGTWSLNRALGTGNDNFVLLSGDGGLTELDASRAVYLDTETTGLSGGAGVFVYMVGLASFTAEGLEVWQGFMDGPEQESALLSEVARRIAESGGVVSFFGKSFDRHRLQDKMSIHGIESPFEDQPHLDLYHPLRRLHRGVYENSKLQTMENALCGLVREDDLPGSMAPEAWFDYLAGRSHRLEGVFRHNCDDVLSLVTLLAWLGEVDRRKPCPQSPSAEAARELALCEALLDRKDFDHVLRRSIPFLERFGGSQATGEDPAASEHSFPIRWLQAEAQRRLHLGQPALDSLTPILQCLSPGVWKCKARALAAKILEHELKDRAEAHAMCRMAMEEMKSLRAFQGRPSLERDLVKREARLAKHLAPKTD